MPLTYIKIFHDCLESMEPLDDAERGRLLTALLIYSRTGEVPVLQGNERFLFPSLRTQLDRDAAAYEKLCEKNAHSAALGWSKRAHTDVCVGSQDKEEDKDQEKDKDKDKQTCVRRPQAAERMSAAEEDEKIPPGASAEAEVFPEDGEWVKALLLELRKEQEAWERTRGKWEILEFNNLFKI